MDALCAMNVRNRDIISANAREPDGGEEFFWERAVGETSKVTVKIAGIEVNAVVYTGSQAITVTEELVRQRLPCDIQPLQLSCFTLTAANCLEIPLAGYLVADVTVRGTVVKDMVVMVLKDQPGN
ncbi:Pol polyprotein [Elysia marginata]|uniref:Pol polyprotein n=1 Tax=Elysia marginata TaxID=1093978 RepID=A0AAV4G3Q8_9GAST|nr:Pol polyprotein [Elysia marginata]